MPSNESVKVPNAGAVMVSLARAVVLVKLSRYENGVVLFLRSEVNNLGSLVADSACKKQEYYGATHQMYRGQYVC
jgi:hypothetical protein